MWILAALTILGSIFFSGVSQINKIEYPLPANTKSPPTPSPSASSGQVLSKRGQNPEVVNNILTFQTPKELRIPKIGLEEEVLAVGLNEKQLVEVPENNVGWYKGGVIPGEKGNATMQGHVTGVFNKLNQLRTGDEIIVDERHFRVIETELINKYDFDVQKVYGETNKRRLNLITCAGAVVNGDFNKRTIIYSELVTQ